MTTTANKAHAVREYAYDVASMYRAMADILDCKVRIEDLQEKIAKHTDLDKIAFLNSLIEDEEAQILMMYQDAIDEYGEKFDRVRHHVTYGTF